MVRYRSDIPEVLRRHEGSGHRQENAPVRAESAAIRGMVVRLLVRACPLCAYLSLCCVSKHTDCLVAVCVYHYEYLQFSNWEVFLKHSWDPTKFFTDYIPIILFPILYVAAKLVMRVPTVRADKMDFVSNVAEFDARTCVPFCLERRVCVCTMLTTPGQI